MKLEKDQFDSDLKEIKNVQRHDSKKYYNDPLYIDFLRQGSLAFDSKKIKEKVIFDTHSGEVVGFAQDAFEMNIIFEEMTRMCDGIDTSDTAATAPVPNTATATTTATVTATSTDTTTATSTATSNDVPPSKSADDEFRPDLVEHYLVFIFTTWAKSERRKIQFVVHRAGLKSITAEYLYREIKEIITDLNMYGFHVTAITGDGATENRFRILMIVYSYCT